mmetsp:Transcript_11181/g.21827  ORF Transcript_11181/g.21827 Transcript_11181/m.21827 type:complete len:115 (-) Transcript_11181:183-527(-)
MHKVPLVRCGATPTWSFCQTLFSRTMFSFVLLDQVNSQKMNSQTREHGLATETPELYKCGARQLAGNDLRLRVEALRRKNTNVSAWEKLKFVCAQRLNRQAQGLFRCVSCNPGR